MLIFVLPTKKRLIDYFGHIFKYLGNHNKLKKTPKILVDAGVKILVDAGIKILVDAGIKILVDAG